MNAITDGADTAQAIDFLKHWAPDGYWLLLAVDPERKQRLEAKSFDAKHEAAAATWIDFWQGKRNLYFSANPPRKAMRSKPDKKEISHVVALHVDIDPAAPPDPLPAGITVADHYVMEQEAILGKLTQYDPPPSVILFSGGGYQGFWLLDKPVELEGAESITLMEGYNRKIEVDLGGDHCFNIDRIMRLPGTINVPDEKKRAKGRVAVAARIEEAHWTRVYPLTQFKRVDVDRPRGNGSANGASPTPNIKGDRLGNRRDPPEWTERIIMNGPDPEGPRAYGGDRSKAVWAVTCALVRSGWSDVEIVEVLLDSKHKISEHVRAQSNPGKYATRQAERARDKVGSDFQTNEKGLPLHSQHKVRLALAQLEVELSFDTFARKVMIEGPHAKPLRPLQDADRIEIYMLIDEQFHIRLRKEFFDDVLFNEAHGAEYHPVRDYLDELKWDGKPRLDTWLVDHCGAKDTPYTRAVGRLLLLAAVRRVRKPGSKFDEMLVMISGQGLDKSTALSVMAVQDEWFTDSLPFNADDKQVIEALTGKWIVEVPELKGIRKNDVEHLKAFLSRQIDRARLAYGRIPAEVPRQSVFFGTTNSDTFLRDITGNRRFWPLAVKKVDIARLRADRDQLWAEAATRESVGESIRLDPELYAQAELEQRRRTIDDPWIGLFENELDQFTYGKIVAHDLWDLLNIPVGMRTQDHNMRVGEVMRALGWRRLKLSHNNKPIWHYAKWDSDDQRKDLPRIFIERDDDGHLTCFLQSAVSGKPYAPNPDDQIPL